MSAPKFTWSPAENERAKECEQAFQNGGPRVYVFDDHRRMPTSFSAERAARYASDAESVYSRRKQGGKYSWFRAALAKVSA